MRRSVGGGSFPHFRSSLLVRGSSSCALDGLTCAVVGGMRYNYSIHYLSDIISNVLSNYLINVLITAFINQKGGCAKSTSAVHFAFWLFKYQKQKVMLVDADAQRSSSIWLNSLDLKLPNDVIQASRRATAGLLTSVVIQSPDELLEQIPELTSYCDHLVVDGPAGLSESTRAILFRTDCAVVPCQPTGVDLQSAADAVRLIRQAQSVRGGPPKAAVFLSRAVKGTKLKDEAIAVLSLIPNIKILKTAIHQKQAIADTFGQGATIWDLPGRASSESKREFEQLFKEVLEILP